MKSNSSSPPTSPATASDKNLTIALPTQDEHQQQPKQSQGPTITPPVAEEKEKKRVGPPLREDCWSDGATSALIDAWGERFVHVGRGSLRQRDWQDVADAVSSREDYTKAPKSHSQCKNRIDTLKKKYKQQLSKSKPDEWQFFDRLHSLLKLDSSSGKNQNPPARGNLVVRDANATRRKKISHGVAKLEYDDDDRCSESSSEGLPPIPPPPKKRRTGTGYGNGNSNGNGGDGEKGEAMRAVMRLVEVYERSEKARAEMEAEAERKRMEFVKEVEVKRVQFYVQAQMEFNRIVVSSSRSNAADAAARNGAQMRRQNRAAGAAAEEEEVQRNNGNGGNGKYDSNELMVSDDEENEQEFDQVDD